MRNSANFVLINFFTYPEIDDFQIETFRMNFGVRKKFLKISGLYQELLIFL